MKGFLRVLKLTTVFLVFLIGSVLAVICFLPGPILRAVAGIVAKKSPVVFSPGDVSGNLVTGLVFRRPQLCAPGADVSVEKLVIGLKWAALFRREVVVSRAEAESPRVLILPQPESSATPKKPAGKSSWAFAAPRVIVRDGRVTIKKGASVKPVLIEAIQLDLGYDADTVTIHNAQAAFSGSTFTVRGTGSPQTLSADARIGVRGLFDGTFDVHGSTTNGTLKGNGTMNGASATLIASIRDGNIWTASATVANADPAAFVKNSSIKIGRVSGRIEANGAGVTAATVRARSSIDVTSTSGPSVKGTVGFKDQKIGVAVDVTGPGITARVAGGIRLPDETIDASWTAKAGPAAFASWTKAASAKSVTLRGRANGRWPALAWSADGSFSKLTVSSASVQSGTFRASGRGVAPPAATVSLHMNVIQAASTRLDAATLEVSGGTRAHHVALTVQSTSYALAAEGDGRYSDELWTMRWSRFNAHAVQDWQSAKPFTTVVGKNLVRVEGLDETSGEARLTLTLAIENNVFRACDAALTGVDLANLSKAGLVKIPLSGRATARASLTGAVSHLEGSARFAGTDLVVDGIDLGQMSARGAFDPARVRIDQLDLRTPNGSVFLSGTVPIASNGKTPDFDVTLKTSGLNLGPLLARAPVQAKDVVLTADVHVSHRAGDSTARGPLRLTAQQVTSKTYGLNLTSLVLAMQGKGPSLDIVEGHAKAGKKGSVTVSGRVSQATFDVHLKTSQFAFATDFGLSARTDIDLAMGGTLDEPRVTGAVNVLRADYTPPKDKPKDKNKKGPDEKKARPSEKKNAAPSSLAMDVHVKFDRNVWYKEKQSAIEAKGDLQVRKNPYEPQRLFGQVETVRGEYIFYGRSFNIQQGQVQFAGDPMTDSVLNIAALYTEQQSKTKITLTVSGSLDKPLLALSSDPVLDEPNIIAILVTGRPLDSDGTASTGGTGSSEDLAKKMAANYFAEEVRQRLQSRIHLDIFQFKMNDQGAADVTVGRNVSKRLFVSYGQTLAANGDRRLQADYTLTKRWNLEGSTVSDGKYVIDLLFNFGFR